MGGFTNSAALIQLLRQQQQQQQQSPQDPSGPGTPGYDLEAATGAVGPMPTDQTAYAQQLNRRAGLINGAPGAPTQGVPNPQNAVPQPGAAPNGPNPQAMRIAQMLKNNLPYMAMGAIGARGGAPGMAAAAGAAALAEYMRNRRTPRKAATSQPPGMATATTGSPDSAGLVGAFKRGGAMKKAKGGLMKKDTDGDKDCKAKGGRLGFRGESSPKLTSIAEDSKKGKRPPVLPVMPMGGPPPISRFAPGSSPMRAPTGKYAKGGMVRGAGAAIRGTSYRGEC